MLNDAHPRIRKYVRLSLIELAKQQQFDAAVRSVATKELLTDQWRSLEQATHVLAALDHKPAANQLVELLEFKRSEVFVTAAWALRKLAVRSTLRPMFDRAERMSKIGGGPEHDMGAIDQQVAHILQALCLMDFKEAEPLMRQHIPKGSQPLESRAAAIWALGHFHKGKPDPELTKLFVERIEDSKNPCDPESSEVCRMAAISLGRMNADDALPDLRQFLSEFTVDTELGFACGWAIQQITGEEPPKKTTRTLQEAGWFLQPLEENSNPKN
jgi:HEAT repeat protein